MRSISLSVAVLLTAVNDVYAAGTVYVTDLPIFSGLAPCAADAVSYVVQGLTDSQCPAAVTALASCACTKNQNSEAVASSISSSVLYNCGSTATEDVSSASVVFGAYCNQGAAAAITTAPGNTVSQFITDLQAYSYLAPCAQNALSYAIQGLTAELCPSAANALASCACTKNQNSLAASETINTSVLGSCCSTCSEDVASAQAVFAGYCGLLGGSSSFASPSYLPGPVSYYITDLPEYSSLAPCAASAVSYQVLAQTNSDCPIDPLAFVSCACVKNQNSGALVSSIASDVSYSCGATASEDLSSALGVFAYYCSAGAGKVTPKGVNVAAPTTTAGSAGKGGKGGFGTSSTGTYYSFGPSATGSSSNNSISATSGHRRPILAIIIGIVAAVVVIGLILVAVWQYRRRRGPRPPPLTSTQESGGTYHQHDDSGKAELGDTGVVGSRPSAEYKYTGNAPAAEPMHPSPAPAYSPVSALSPDEKNNTNVSSWPMPPSNRVEMPAGVGRPQIAEVLGDERPPQPQQHGFNFGNGIQPYYEAGGRPRPVELSSARPGANLNQGPVYEMSSF